jgi:hypothetical protein
LIREKFNIENPFVANASKFISTRMIALLLEDLLKRAGINQLTTKRKREVHISHGMRKMFLSICDRASMNYSVREMIVGHKLRNLDSHYIYKTEEDLLAEYIKIVDLLTFDPSVKLQEKVKELEKQHITKEAWEAMQTEMNRIKNLLILLKFDQLSQEKEKEE